ncbi:MAG: cell division protein FtsA [Elusimicrobia bacterium]|nr:cell division protein FtsA [Elusimicrobiota bacterium]
MAKSEILAGLDIGSGKVTCIIAERDEDAGKIRVLGGGSAECKGLKAGMVINIEETARAISLAVDAAESKAGQVVSQVLLGIRGAHIQAYEGRGRYNIARTDQEITAEDVTSVIENAKAFQMQHGLEILHVIPQRFSLDHLTGVPNPIGMQCALLEVGVHIVLASTPVITNLIKAVAMAGFSLADNPIYTPLALGALTVSDEEKDLGTLLVDIGGQTTSIAIYADGVIHFSKELPVGADHITKDLAHGLSTTLATAKAIKEKYGAVYSELIDPDRLITVTKLDMRTKKEIPQRDLLSYIQPRAEEIFELIFQAVQKSNYSDLPGGAAPGAPGRAAAGAAGLPGGIRHPALPGRRSANLLPASENLGYGPARPLSAGRGAA